ncbi:MAG: HlyC/CorC family transporter [Crocinitomicaceae bacterium]|nr:HlyC/CorC family transporter [Crocinitomicaceae bacterium]
MDSGWLLFVIFSLVASAFSSGMEIAFITANKLKVELDRKQEVFGAGIISYFMRKPKMFIATMLIGNNIALVIYGIFMGDAIVYGIEKIYPGLFGPTEMLISQTIISTVIVLIFGEFIPKAVFSINPNRWLQIFAIPLMFWVSVLWIFAWVVTSISEFILKLAMEQKSTPQQVEFGRIDLDHYLKQATGNIDHSKMFDHEIQIFQNALDFSKVKARDCLIPRNEIVAVDITDTIEHLRKLFIETRLSKILVFRESIDHIIGYVHSFELFKKPEQIQHILRPVVIIPKPAPANEILEKFIKEKKNVAVVVDEFGGTAGIITMEDIVEEIFGEIEDEHDKEETTEIAISDHEFEFSARLEIDYLNDKYNLGLPVNNEEYDTLSGLILHIHEDIPQQGAVVEHQNFTFNIQKATETRIELVLVIIKD